MENRFNKEGKLTGWDWLKGFPKRYPGISLRKEENLSINRAVGMNRDEAGKMF